ncbi:hypothetical protein SAMN05428970_0564 [Agromyces sp. CF514]|uniref:hypothetical protein n=1 Tax=Agromyces sp. CF514 TaxID=1881031 RepID=UPI0008F13F8B|nr:hypothetical protein [Agromyces sp. CF514]SFR68966.1 hypothetical protein SAMN05428970_0564 [Agromyces sp. CF514]
MSAWETVGAIAEVIGWVGLAVGLACMLLVLLIRIADGRWLPTDALVVDGAEGSVVRWFAEGEFHSRRLSADERHHVADPQQEPAFYREREPEHLRLHEPPAGRRVLRLLGIVFLALAVVAGIVGVIAMLVA